MAYTEGSVVRIKLENFLTYDSAEFTCGPRLNVIIGPNGTGKSTIVCAICLGLAGKTSWLGRSQHITDFIKYGKTKARIELTLHNEKGDDYHICREINKEAGNTNKWWVNKRPATQRTIEDLVARMNIQIGNLTQFLPQDKVADFAKMSEYELLEATEKSVGETQMYETHQKLKESQSKAKNLQQEYDNLQERLNQERQKNARIEQDVRNYEERQTFLEKIEKMKVKLAWLEYEEKRDTYLQIKQDKLAAEKEFKRITRINNPLKKQIDEAKAEKAAITLKIRKRTQDLKAIADRAAINGSEADTLSDQTNEVYDELKLQKEKEEDRRKRLQELRKQLEALESDLRNVDDTVDVQPELDQVARNIREVTHQMALVNQQGDRISVEVGNHNTTINGINRDLKVLRDVESQRLQVLRARHRDTYNAVMWLRENKGMFTGTIHEPIMLCVNMKNPQMAKYVENHIRFNDMTAFVCETSEDMNKFMDIMRETQNLRVNAVKVPPRVNLDALTPDIPISRLRRFGFQCYLKDLFTCPEAVMKFMCVQYRVQHIPVGNANTTQMMEELRRSQPNLNMFYTHDSQYLMKKSRYDGDISTRSTKLKNASLLTVSTDENRERELLQQLQAANEEKSVKEATYNQLQNKSRQMNQQLNQHREEKRQLMIRKDQKQRLLSQVETKKQTIHWNESEKIDLAEEESKAHEKIHQIDIKKHKNLQTYTHNIKELLDMLKEKICLSLHQTQASRRCQTMETNFLEQMQQLQQAEITFNREKERSEKYKLMAKDSLVKAKQASGIGANENLPQHYMEIFKTLPDTIDEIEAKIHEHQIRADTIVTNDRVKQEFSKRRMEITAMETELETREREKNNHQATVEEAKTQWIEPLEALIARINISFSHFFTSLQCVGEVDLHIPGDPEEYSKYGVRIKVKFRDNEPLQVLSAYHQSGGERSVTTVLYMLALQELAKCPFRCVDEINQGMDAHNERKVFELVVKTVCGKSNSQYFLLTPKLLPDLEYADNMTILCVYNGKHMVKHSKWNIDKFIARQNQLEADQ